MKGMKTLIFLCLFMIFLASFVEAAQLGQSVASSKNSDPKPWCLTTTWPHEQSDLVPDPALIFGRLENGSRYILLKNQEPKGRVGIYLDIQTGSLYETEEQRGIAHFL